MLILMSTALATTVLPNAATVSVDLTVGQLRLIEAALFDRGIMSSADAHEGRKTREAHGTLFLAIGEVSNVIDSAVRRENRRVALAGKSA